LAAGDLTLAREIETVELDDKLERQIPKYAN
jgi:hypothetical protein